MIEHPFRYEQRPCFPVPSIQHQTLLSKAMFEHCLDYVEIAIIALASKSIQNSSLAPNFTSKIYVNDAAIKLLDSVFHPSSALPIQFIPELTLLMLESTNDEAALKQKNNFILALNQTKYFRQSIRRLDLLNPLSYEIFCQDKNNDDDDICVFSGLEYLQLCGPKNVTETEISVFNSQKIFPRLATIEVFDVLDNATLEKISRMTKLKLFDNWNEFYCDESSLILAKNSPNISRLLLGFSNNTSEETFRLIGTSLTNITNLNVWALSDVGFNDQSFNHLASLRRLKTLSFWQNNFFTDFNLECIVSSCTEIEELNIMDCCKITDVGISHVAEHLHETLRAIRVPGTGCGVEGMKSLGKCRKLEEFESGGLASLENEAVKYFLVGPDNNISPLRILIINHADIDDEGLHHLSEFAPNLTRLALNFCPNISFSNTNLCFPNLAHLDIAGCALTQAGLANVIAACTNNIRSADFTNIKAVNDATLTEIAASWWRLEDLKLQGCDSFTEACLANTVMTKCVRLKSLVLSFCPMITNDFFRDCFSQLRRLSEIKAVRCSGLTRGSCEIMKKECPRVIFVNSL